MLRVAPPHDIESFLKKKNLNVYSLFKLYLIHLKINLLAELLALLKSSLIKLDLSTEVEDISLPPFCFFVSPQSLQIILGRDGRDWVGR